MEDKNNKKNDVESTSQKVGKGTEKDTKSLEEKSLDKKTTKEAEDIKATTSDKVVLDNIEVANKAVATKEAADEAKDELGKKDQLVKDTPAKEESKEQTEQNNNRAEEVASSSTKKQVRPENKDYATGKRKNSIARVWLKPGSGEIRINGKLAKDYFGRATYNMIIKQPFVVSNRENELNVNALAHGGGLSGQAGALRHGISKALAKKEPDLRNILKKAGFLTRDSRIVERKKYGKRKARRSFQFSKR